MREWDAEVIVEADLARRLIGEQFPELGLRTIKLLGQGWDNTVWRVDDEWTFRFPRRSYAVPGIENEMAVLPRLAGALPLPIPNPTFLGRPSEEFAWPFYGCPFLPGRELADADLSDEERIGLARPLAEFLRTLHSLDLDAELPVDPVRRADMAVRIPRTREYLSEVSSLGLWAPPSLVGKTLEAALELPPAEHTAVCHGDLHLRHLLVDEHGGPAAVIDWIDLSRNDPAVDLVLFWSLLPPDGRAEFRETYGELSEAQLLRGRVLALFLCAVLALYGRHEGLSALEREAIAGLTRTAR